MKKYVLLLLPLFFMFAGCEEQPVIIPTGNSNQGGGGSGSSDTIFKNVLLEDLTGVRCPNCPQAATAIKDIQSVFGKENVIDVGIHGFFLSAPVYPEDVDLRNPFARSLEFFIQPSAKPAGTINRTLINTNGSVNEYFNLLPDEWPSLVQAELSRPADMTLDIELDYNAGSRELTVTANGKGINEVNDQINISIYLVQSGIVTHQEDEGPVPVIEDYEHERVLLDGMTDFKGDLFAPSLMPEEEITMTFTRTLPAQEEVKWNVEDMEVIAFLSSGTTDKLEVYYTAVAPILN